VSLENQGVFQAHEKGLLRCRNEGSKSHSSGAEKHPDFQVTSCHHFDTTNANFAYIESE
jgi:hypothetical protein